MKVWSAFFLFGLTLACRASGTGEDARPFDWGFVASRQVDLNGETHTKVLGPFFERVTAPDGKRFWAFRPLYSNVRDPKNQKGNQEFLWPLASSREFKYEQAARVLLAYYHDYDARNPNSKYHFWLLPLYFQGRDTKTNNYHALFPLGGVIKDFLGLDDIRFILFPLVAKSSQLGTTNRNILWPVFMRSTGGGIERWRVFPVFGHSVYHGTQFMNFFLWPVFTWVKDTRPGLAGWGYIVFPLWGHMLTVNYESIYLIPPLFRFTDDKKTDVIHCPWPFLQFKKGEVNQIYIMPFWGRKEHGVIQSMFFIWPLGRYQKTDRGTVVKERFMLLPFYQSEKYTTGERAVKKGKDKIVEARYRMLWPLGSYRREGAVSRLRAFEFVPLKNAAPIERNYNAFWTVYTHNANGRNTQDELLWGLYRHSRRGSEACSASLFPLFSWDRDDAGKPNRRWSALKGLVGYQREGTQRSLRLLYWFKFNLGASKP